MGKFIRLIYALLLGILGMLVGLITISTQVSTTAAMAAVIQVAPAGVDQPGCGGGPVCRTIKYAVEVRAQPGDQIQVAPGVYTEAFTVSIPNLQIIGAGVDQSIVDGEGVRGPLVTFTSNATWSTIFSGFTIRHGLAASDGGGLYLDHSSPTLQFIKVQSNTASTGRGGGLYLIEGSPVITGSLIQFNTAITGGGLYLTGNSTPTVNLNAICGNTGWQVYQPAPSNPPGSSNLNPLDFQKNWWATDPPESSTFFSTPAITRPAMALQIRIISAGTGNFPITVGSSNRLDLKLLDENNTDTLPFEVTIKLMADDALFPGSLTQTTLTLINGDASTVITPKRGGSHLISAFYECDPFTAVVTKSLTVLEDFRKFIYLPVIRKS